MYTHILSIHSPVSKHLGCFFLLAIVNHAAMNLVYKYLCTSLLSGLFFFFEYMSRCGIAGSYSSSRLNFWSQFHTVSHHGCPVLQSHQHAQDPSFLNGHLTTVSHALGLDTAFSRLFFKLNILQVALHEDGHFRVDFFKGKNQRGGM